MIQKWILFSCFLCLSLVHSQGLEDSIYNHLDRFIESPSPSTLQQLDEKETDFANQVQSKEEFLALVILNSNLGYYYRQFGNNQKAIRQYEKAWKNYREKKLDGYDIIEFCLKPLGNLYTIIGDFTNAENTIKSYYSFAEKQNIPSQKIAGILNLSVVYHNTGKHNTAIELLKQGLKMPNLTNKQKLTLENNLSTNLMALQQYEEAQNLLNQKVNTDFLSLRNNAQLAAQQGDFNKAMSLLKKAENKLSEEIPFARDLARFYVDKANLFTRKNEPKKAAENFLKSLQILIPGKLQSSIPDKSLLYPENTFISIFDGLAALQDSEMEALKYYDLSFYVSSLLYSQYTTQEVKVIHQAAWKRRTERCLEILFELYSTTSDFQFVERAFAYAEKSKATVLRENFSQKTLLETHPNNETLLKREQLESHQEQKLNALIREQLTTKETEKLQFLNDTLTDINLALKQLHYEIAQEYPDTISDIISLKEIQAKVQQDNALLVSYFFGKEALYRFDIYDKKTNFQKSTVNAKLNKAVSEFISYFENSSTINNDVTAYVEDAHLVYTILLPKMLPKSKNLILIPDGLLHFIPFDALLTEPTKSTTYTSMPFLTKQNNLVYNTSASLYYDAKTPDKENSVLGVFPIFKSSAQPLTYSLEEAKNLDRAMKSNLLMHQEASKENFMALAQDNSILHLSTHAHGGSFTIPAAMEFYDDVMLLQEFYSLNLNPKLVVLSACETGVGKIQSGEGAMSLARGFQYAGAQNILFSLWKVNDLSTSQLMTSFYENYSNQESAFTANRYSKLAYLKNTEISNAKKSPYYWSGFVYYGALDEETKNKNTLWYLGVLFVLMALIFMYFFRKKK